ncbi:hypothetical protein EYF80_023305 [Liparis tanakae]|uniref:Uncharacterized protein n=1 Tax=Liparis tanakae TaxID=230148 RepID=A0A4Z2HKN4_9TELE|nr:hypothetical protein EYF80_023305 [Liparis tanakae]
MELTGWEEHVKGHSQEALRMKKPELTSVFSYSKETLQLFQNSQGFLLSRLKALNNDSRMKTLQHKIKKRMLWKENISSSKH